MYKTKMFMLKLGLEDEDNLVLQVDEWLNSLDIIKVVGYQFVPMNNYYSIFWITVRIRDNSNPHEVIKVTSKKQHVR